MSERASTRPRRATSTSDGAVLRGGVERDDRGGWRARDGEPAATTADGSPASAESMANAAREICLRLLTVRARTRAELDTALHRRGIPPDVADAVLARLAEVGLVDDAAFAQAWVASRSARGVGRARLAEELRRKGVVRDLADDALVTLDPAEESLGAQAVARRALARSAGQPRDVRFRRAVAAVARRGYPSGAALAAVRAALAADTTAAPAERDLDGGCADPDEDGRAEE